MTVTSRRPLLALTALGALALPASALTSCSEDGGGTGTDDSAVAMSSGDPTTGSTGTGGTSTTATSTPTGTDSTGGAPTGTGAGTSTTSTGTSSTTAPTSGTSTPADDSATTDDSALPDDSNVGDDSTADDSAMMDDVASPDDDNSAVTDDVAVTDDSTVDDVADDSMVDDMADDGATDDAGDSACAFDGPRTPPELGSWPPPGLKLTEVSSATQPTAIAAPRCDPSRLYFAEKWGVIRLIKDGVLLDEPALDLREAVLEGGPQGSDGPEMQNQGKRGLVGLAIHPNFEENGRIFVMYTADQGIPGYGTNDHSNLYDDGDMTFAEYRRSADDPDKFDPEPVSVFLQFDKGNCNQCSQHNGGSLEIGVDGYLWASTGDPPPYDNPGSADLNNLNGKILRFDISGDEVTAAGNYPGADPYVWSIGIRNAYKFSIDRYTGDMYVADVGENSWEEVSVEMYGDGNKDHGWPKKEGFQSFMALSCDEPNCLEPVFDYGHSGAEGTPGADNCIIGGYVYRGSAIPALQGAYIYGDFGSGKIRAIQVVDGEMLNGPHDFQGLNSFMGCFGEDAAGEMYVCDYEGGKILRIDAQ